MEQANRELGEEQRQIKQERREFLKHGEEQHKQHGAAIVAAERKQKMRVGAARKSIFDAHKAEGSLLLQQRDSLREELSLARLAATQRQIRRVEETKNMQLRAILNVSSVKESHPKGKKDALHLEAMRNEERQERLNQKRERARLVREQTSQHVLDSSRALLGEEKAQTGETLRAIGSIGRLQRDSERLDHLRAALIFREDVRSWQESSRIVRAQIDEDRREHARVTREQREVHEEVCHRASLQAMIERKEAHDAICMARQADEELAMGYREFQEVLLSEADSNADKRVAAAKRATVARQRCRKQGQRRGRKLLTASSPPQEVKI